MTLDELQALLPDRYRVIREIGRGGMATVYLADDLPNDRQVAIKVMSGELGASLDGVRFQREVEIAARLTHPNILPAYDSGSGNGILFYTMPFIAGESVRARLDRERQISVDEAIAITAETCEALTYAHAAGIVHRDIKPENILLENGHAVVADFGIARLVAEGGGHTLTQTGLSLGTAQYMSPEQASAEKVDGRSDVYALGCVLYEMLVGEPPFTGPNAMAVLARAVTQPVPSVRVVRSSVPEHLEFAIMRALEKVPVDRFATAEEFKQAIMGDTASMSPQTRAYTAAYASARRAGRPVGPVGPAWRRPRVLATGVALVLVAAAGAGAWSSVRARRAAASAAADDAKRVGVMYFEDKTGSGALRYLADGLTESLIEELDRAGLDVRSRDAVRPFRGMPFNSDSVHRALGVGTIVRGELTSEGRVPQVTVRLVDGVSGSEIKNARFDFDTANALVARTEVTRRVAEFLRTEVGLDVQLKVSRLRASSPQAWTQLQRGERILKDADSMITARAPQPALAVLDSADASIGRAITLDATWPEPWIARARGYRSRALAQRERPDLAKVALDSGRAAVEKALALDPRSADAHEVAGTIAYAHVQLRTTQDDKERDALLERAENELGEAVRLNKQQATAFATLSFVEYARKAVPAALQAARNAYEADAYLLNARTIIERLFYGNYDTENFPEARRWCDEGHRRFPRSSAFVKCRLFLMMAKGGKPDPDEAWQLADTIRALATPTARAYEDHEARTLVGGVLGKAGLTDSANKVLIAARADRDVDPNQVLFGREITMRLIYGDIDTAISRLGEYFLVHPDHRKGFANQTAWFYRNPKFQSDPRFQKMIAGAQ